VGEAPIDTMQESSSGLVWACMKLEANYLELRAVPMGCSCNLIPYMFLLSLPKPVTYMWVAGWAETSVVEHARLHLGS